MLASGDEATFIGFTSILQNCNLENIENEHKIGEKATLHVEKFENKTFRKYSISFVNRSDQRLL